MSTTGRFRVAATEYLAAIGIVAATTVGGLLLRRHLQLTDIAMLFLLGVVVVAYRFRRGPAVLASLLSIAAFDFGFVPPVYALDVHNVAFVITFGVMLLVALIMTQLTSRIGEQAADAREREQQTAALLAMTRDLSEAGSLGAEAATVLRHLGRAGRGEALVVLEDVGEEGSALQSPKGVFESVDVRVAAEWTREHGESAGWGTQQCAEADTLVVPLKGATRILGVVAIKPFEPERMLTGGERRIIEALADQAATTFDRRLLAQGREQARIEAESERLRTALLSSLSHDLRTPLGSIEGAASSLLQEPESVSPGMQREMAETILEESRRMTRLVGNLLDMVRVETGALAVQKSWQPLEEALGVALLRLEERLSGRAVEVSLPEHLPLVPIDELLIEQVFINLLENAAKYTPAGTGLSISAWPENHAVIVEVADRGPGIPEGEEEAVFRKFHRTSTADQAGPPGGSGLGLTICRGIVAAHGGRIWAERRPSGAAFRFSLPLEGPPLGVPPADAVV